MYGLAVLDRNKNAAKHGNYVNMPLRARTCLEFKIIFNLKLFIVVFNTIVFSRDQIYIIYI